MKNFAENVIDFNQRVLGITPRETGLLAHAELTLTEKCLREEIEEFHGASINGDILGAIDGLIDLMYFAVGGLYKMGLNSDDISIIGGIVHDCNMSKKLGIVAKRGDGSAADAVKPTDWVSPEESIAHYLSNKNG